MDAGQIKMTGDISECVRQYMMHGDHTSLEKTFEPMGEELILRRATIRQPGNPGEMLTSHPTVIEADLTVQDLTPASLICGFTLRDDYGNDVFSTYFNDMGDFTRLDKFSGAYRLRCVIPPNTLNAATYRIVFNVGVATIKQYTTDDTHFLEFSMANVDGVGTKMGGRPLRPGPILPLLDWDVT